MKTTEQFINEANLKHNNEYDYSETVYTGSKNKVKIICHKKFDNGEEHGIFEQEANSHLKGCGCPYCNGTIKLTMNDIIRKNNEIHNGKYSFEHTIYVNNHTDFIVTCPIHGDFTVKPNNFFNGGGCQKCSKFKRYSTEEIKKELYEIFGDKYDFSNTVYVNTRTKLKAICPIHGEFERSLRSLRKGIGCEECRKIERMKSFEEFVKDAESIHGKKYKYVEYKGDKVKIPIVCHIHGTFEMTPNSHLNGQGCPDCGYEKNASKKRTGKKNSIEKFIKIYGNLYDYSLWTEPYKNIKEKIKIICKKHGVFEKTIHQHLQGQGCQICKISKLENEIRIFLLDNKIKFTMQKTFPWLKRKKKGQLKLDFYLDEYNIGIECQGGQHYEPCDVFGGQKEYENTVERDAIKKKLCEENNIPILYFADHKYEKKLITNKKILLKEIKKYGKRI